MVGEADSGPRLLPGISQTNPELVLLDLQLPGVDAPTALERIRGRDATIRVIGLATHPNVEEMHNVCLYGATGVILKTIPAAELGGAIRQIMDGTTFTALGGSPFVPSPAHEAGLTEREREILERVAKGHSNKQIAGELFVQLQTVKFHLSNIYRKLGLQNRTAAARWAYANGLTAETYTAAAA